jgi:hypothetical protein
MGELTTDLHGGGQVRCESRRRSPSAPARQVFAQGADHLFAAQVIYAGPSQ